MLDVSRGDWPSRPLALRFREDEHGADRAVSIEGRPLRWGTVAGILDKVT